MTDTATRTQDYITASSNVEDMGLLPCCCRILDDTLGPDEHLHDCEQQLFTGEFSLPLTDDSLQDTNSDDTGSIGSVRDCDAPDFKKRKHRESMARLRKKLRESIDTLQLEERQLARTLQRTLAAFRPQPDPTGTKHKLQLAYFKLVKEQLALQDERRILNETWAQKDKYERLVQRELCRMDAATEAKDEDDKATMMHGVNTH